MYIWSLKMERFVLFTLKMKFLPKDFTRLYKLGIKTGVWYSKMYIWSLKMEKFVLEMKCLPKHLTRLYKLGDKNWSLVPQNVHFVNRNGKNCTFYTRNEVLPKNLTRLYKLGIKTGFGTPKCTFGH